ncbi:MAG: OmpA family protein [Acidobacteriota bacterium]
MGRSTVISLGLVALLLLAFLCATLHRASIESDLLTRASASLAEAGFEGLELTAEGRDLTLSGSVVSGEERQQALDAAKVDGVRVAIDDLQEVAEPPTPSIGTAWRIDAAQGSDGVLAWSGLLAPTGLQQLEVETAQVFDPAPSRFAIDAGEAPSALWTPEQWDAIRAALPFLATIPNSALSASPGRLVLRGAPDSLTQAQAVRNALLPRLPAGMALDVEWQRLWRPEELRLELAAQEGAWDLSGLVPRGSAEGWVTRVRGAGFEPLTDGLIEADLEAPEGFGGPFGAALGSLAGLPGGRLVESSGGLDFSGLSDDAALAVRLRQAVEASLPEGVDLRFSVAPKLESADCEKQLRRELEAEKILFASGSAALDPRSDALLRRLSSTLQRCPGAAVRIEGHTDSDGDDAFNLRLSDRRAAAVEQRMVALGVDPLRLVAEGFGETRPIAAGDSAAAKRQNRRIDFRLQEDA